MTFVADESVAGPIIDRLRADGWAVAAVRETARGAIDPDVLASATGTGAVLLTEDKDFGELVYRERLAHLGLVLLRVDALPRGLRAEFVSRAVREHAPDLPDAFTVITPGGVRIRRLAPPLGD